MHVLLIAVIALAVCFAMVFIAAFTPVLGRKTCDECGGQLPAVRLDLDPQSERVLVGDWACPKCGTRFDPQGRARDQQSN